MGRFDSFRRAKRTDASSPTSSEGPGHVNPVADHSGATSIGSAGYSTASTSQLTRQSNKKDNMKKEKYLMRKKQADDEYEIELSKFRKKSLERRDEVDHMGLARGWDYINWKPFDWHRYDYNPNDYQQKCSALAPYVRSVLISGCEGSKEKRWENLTAGKHQEGLYSRTMSQSRLGLAGSRFGSQASISHVGRN